MDEFRWRTKGRSDRTGCASRRTKSRNELGSDLAAAFIPRVQNPSSLPTSCAATSALDVDWRANGRIGFISMGISSIFGGTGFVIAPDAAVTLAVAGGATPPKVKERGWFPWAASPATVRATPQPLGLFLRNISHRWGTDSHRSEDDQAALRRSVSSRPRRRILTGC